MSDSLKRMEERNKVFFCFFLLKRLEERNKALWNKALSSTCKSLYSQTSPSEHILGVDWVFHAQIAYKGWKSATRSSRKRCCSARMREKLLTARGLAKVRTASMTRMPGLFLPIWHTCIRLLIWHTCIRLPIWHTCILLPIWHMTWHDSHVQVSSSPYDTYPPPHMTWHDSHVRGACTWQHVRSCCCGRRRFPEWVQMVCS